MVLEEREPDLLQPRGMLRGVDDPNRSAHRANAIAIGFLQRADAGVACRRRVSASSDVTTPRP